MKWIHAIVLLATCTMIATGCAGAAGSSTTTARAVQASPRYTQIVKVFLQETITADERLELIADIESMQGIAPVTYMSKSAALKRARRLFRNEPDLLKGISGNPFSASLEIYGSPDAAGHVVDAVQRRRGVDKAIAMTQSPGPSSASAGAIQPFTQSER